jgi:hypothetical protein
MTRIALALFIAGIVYFAARVVGLEDFGKIAAPITSLITALIPKLQDEKPITIIGHGARVHARLEEGFTAGLLGGITISIALVRGYLVLMPNLPPIRFSAEVAVSFVPATAVLGVAIAIVDAWGATIAAKRTWLINEVMFASGISIATGALAGSVIGWHFSEYHIVRPFAPPELLLAGCIPAGAIIGIALALRRGRRLNRSLILPLLIVSIVIVSFTVLIVVVADAADLGGWLQRFMYRSFNVGVATLGGALYGAITGCAVGVTGGLTMFLLRVAATRSVRQDER